MQKECVENERCAPLEGFLQAFEEPRHERVRSVIGKRVFSTTKKRESDRFFALFREGTCLWPSRESPDRTRISHVTSLEGLEGILKSKQIEPRVGENTEMAANPKAVYLTAGGVASSYYGNYAVILRNSSLVGKSNKEIALKWGDALGVNTPISITPDSLECIAIETDYVNPEHIEEIRMKVSEWAGWDIPIRSFNEVEAEMA